MFGESGRGFGKPEQGADRRVEVTERAVLSAEDGVKSPSGLNVRPSMIPRRKGPLGYRVYFLHPSPEIVSGPVGAPGLR